MTKSKKNHKNSAARTHRAEIAQETLAIIHQGAYQTAQDTQVSIREQVDAAVSSTRLYDLRIMPPLASSSSSRRFETSCDIEVTDETTFLALERASCSDTEKENHVACLNFASAKNPGGGFLGGSQAQEEALARASALYPCLQTQLEGYYEPNRANESALYLDLAIVTPLVPFFRNDQGNLLSQPILCTVITSPAPNASAIMRKQKKEGDDELHKEQETDEIQATLVRRAEMILHCAALHQVDTLILGAWGCGVFGNEPAVVAQTFQRLLRDEYQYCFRRVIFAVFDPSKKRENFHAFTRILAA